MEERIAGLSKNAMKPLHDSLCASNKPSSCCQDFLQLSVPAQWLTMIHCARSTDNSSMRPHTDDSDLLKRIVCPAGERSMLEADICSAAAQSPDGMTATRDLQAAIAAQKFPQYNLFVQALDPAAISSLGFYPLDATKAGLH